MQKGVGSGQHNLWVPYPHGRWRRHSFREVKAEVSLGLMEVLLGLNVPFVVMAK